MSVPESKAYGIADQLHLFDSRDGNIKWWCTSNIKRGSTEMRILCLLKKSQEKGFVQIDKPNPLVSECVYPKSRYNSWFNHWSSLSTC